MDRESVTLTISSDNSHARSRRRFSSLRGDDRGAVTVEFVLWFPFVIFLLAILTDFVFIYMTNSSMWSAARQAAEPLTSAAWRRRRLAHVPTLHAMSQPDRWRLDLKRARPVVEHRAGHRGDALCAQLDRCVLCHVQSPFARNVPLGLTGHVGRHRASGTPRIPADATPAPRSLPKCGNEASTSLPQTYLPTRYGDRHHAHQRAASV